MNLSCCGVLRQLVQQNLNVYLYDNAQFFAERLYYESPTGEHLYMLANCFYLQSKIKQAYLLLQESNHPQCRYLFALCCIALKKYREGERALLPPGFDVRQPSRSSLDSIPGGAAGLYLLGSICRAENRRDSAISYYQASLQVEPTLWSSICDLSELGVIIESAELFGTDYASAASTICGAKPPTTRDLQPNRHAAPSRSGDMSEVLEHRRVMESPFINSIRRSSSDLTPSATPSATMSLGLSSLSLRMPFASPGPMAAAAAVPSAVPASLHRFDLQGAEDSMSLSGRPGGARMLFEMTPGGTPGAALTHVAAANVAEMSSPRGRGGISHSEAIDSDYGHQADVRLGSSSVGATTEGKPRNRLPPSSASSPGAHLVRPLGGINLAFGTEDESGADRMRGAGRRVSFGPTARLSFSSMGVGGNGMDLDGEADFDFGATVDDDSPMKVMRMAGNNSAGVESTSAESYQSYASRADESFFVSPIASSAETPFEHTQVRDNVNSGMFNSAYSEVSASRMSDASSTVSAETMRLIGAVEAATPAATVRKASAPETVQGYGGSALPGNRLFRDQSTNASYQVGESLKFGRDSSNIENSETSHMNVSASLGLDFSDVSGGGAATEVGQCSGVQMVAALLCVFTNAYQNLCFFRCLDCIHSLHHLPTQHFKSGWVQHHLGRAYYELCDYRPALLALKEMVRLEPFRVKGTEILSTVLWHLKREKELCALAQQIVEVDKLAPETWCVVGNCFSLQKETDVAIRYFKRALQLDPRFIYAHTLCGHELVNNEDLDKAIASFRMALLHDDRHYNAWYGLGSIYFRQEKHEMAELHFRRAISVNPVSSVLKCYLSMVLHAQGTYQKTAEAMQMLVEASASDPKNPQLHFQRAHIMFSTLDGLHDGPEVEAVLEECLRELFIVRSIAPREPPLYAMLGQIYHRMGNVQEAIRNYNTAIDLDPKEAAGLKALLETL